jgi:hypothetical protein
MEGKSIMVRNPVGNRIKHKVAGTFSQPDAKERVKMGERQSEHERRGVIFDQFCEDITDVAKQVGHSGNACEMSYVIVRTGVPKWLPVLRYGKEAEQGIELYSGNDPIRTKAKWIIAVTRSGELLMSIDLTGDWTNGRGGLRAISPKRVHFNDLSDAQWRAFEAAALRAKAILAASK